MNFNTAYLLARSLDLENRGYHDSRIGVSPQSAKRVSKLFGFVPTDHSIYTPVEWPHVFTSDVDSVAENQRVHIYFNLHFEAEIKACLVSGHPVIAAFNIFRQFHTAVAGVIAFPDSCERSLPENHSVSIIGYNDSSGYFEFANSWGRDWGDSGIGYLPYGYLGRYMIDVYSWSGLGPIPQALTQGLERITTDRGEYERLITGFHSPVGRIFYRVDIFDHKCSKEVAWTICFANDTWLEVEELFVAPAFRRNGHAYNLLDSLQFLASHQERKLRFHVPVIDCITLQQDIHDLAFKLNLLVTDPLVYCAGKTLLSAK